MTQSFIQPKGSLNTKVDTSNMQQLLAQIFANQQLQGQAEQQAAEQDPVRQTVNDLVKSKLMQNIEIPQYTTVQDIFKAPTGEKFEKFGSYLNTPTGQNLLGSLLGLVSGGKYYSTPTDSYNMHLQNDMQRRQMQALASQKEQNDLAQAMANAYNQRDIADENNKRMRELTEMQIEWQKQKAADDRVLEREKMANDLERARIIHHAMSGGSTGGAAGMTKEEKEKLDSANLIYNQLNALQSEFDKLPQSTALKGTQKGKALQTGWSNKIGLRNDNVAGFMAIRNPLTSQLARTIGGEKGVLTDRDFERASAMLPSEFDSPQQAAAKMRAVKNLVAARYGITDNSQTTSTNKGNAETMQVGGYTIKVKQ